MCVHTCSYYHVHPTSHCARVSMREKDRVCAYVCVSAVWVCMCLPVCPLCVGVSVGGRPAFIIPELVSNPGLLSGL